MKLHNPYPFDVDDTLIQFEDFDKSVEGIVFVDTNNKESLIVKPILANLELLKQKHSEGYQIILWSQCGADYAESAAKSLNIEHLVTLFMTKPTEYCDDLPASAWMKITFNK